jgi:hypothetical protein
VIKGISQTHSIKTLNLDNHISPEARLAYSMDCVLFELEKIGINRKNAADFLAQME